MHALRVIRHTARLLTVAAALTLSACQFGKKPSEVDWVMSPNGARVALRVVGETADRVGELLTVTDSNVVVRGASLVRVSWSRVQAIDVDQLSGSYDVLRGQRVTQENRRQLALVSRFPQGITPDIMVQLLALSKQAAIEEIK